ncbi:MAG TPA: hypothetical protein VFF69_12830 [Phycisphaerales bacterium]|nr:hypothetical protein [Phycisphaerales bacterium]
MNAKSWMKQAVAATAVAASVFSAACSTSDPNAAVDRDSPYLVGSDLYTRAGARRSAAPAPAPREEPRREAPREQPRRQARGCDPVVEQGQNVVTQAFPTGDMSSSAIVVHTVMPDEVRLGQPYQYQLQVCNLTETELQNVVVTNENTNNLEITEADPRPSRGPDGNPQWVLGSLAPDDMQIITVTGVARESGVSSNCVTVSYNNFLCAETRVVSPDLALVKTATSEALACEPIELTYTVSNTGTGSCDNVVVTDELPEGLTLAEGGRSVRFNAGTLAAGESKEHRVSVRAAGPGRYTSAPSVTSDCGIQGQAEPVSTIVRQPVLAMEADCGGERVFLGRNVTFTFNLSNTGDAACNETVVTARLPSGATFVSADNNGQASGNTVTWNVGSIPAEGGERSVSVTVSPQGLGDLEVSATAECVCAEPVTANCSIGIQGIPAILLEVIDSNDPIQIGEEVTYVIQVTNQGSAPGTGIRIVCELPTEETFVSAGGATTGTLSGRTVTFAPLPNLPPKARAEFRVTVRANAPADVRFLTSMTSDQFERPVQETESTNLYE